MRVVTSQVASFALEADRPVASSAARWSRREGLLLRVADAEGRQGTGEASPLPGYSPDDLERARGEIERWSAGLPLEFDDCLPLPPQIEQAGRGWRLGPGARHAVEGALLDLAARSAGIPLAGLIAGRPPRAEVKLQALVPLADPAWQLEQAVRHAQAGYGTLKVKLPADPGECPRIAETLRRELGPRLELRFDINGGWTLEQARRTLPLLAAARPEYVEQPVAAGDLLRLRRGAVPLAADESLQDDKQAKELIAQAEVAVLVLKPMVLGGTLRCLRLARRARRRGIGVVVSHTFGGSTEWLHAVHLSLALAAEGPLRACGLAPHPFLRDDGPASFLADRGRIRPWTGAGIAADVADA